MKLTKQTVYLTVKVEDELPAESCKCGIIKNGEFDLSYFIKTPSYKVFDHVKSGLSHNQAEITHWLKPRESFVFTPEQLNEYTANVIKKTLETAAENAEITNKAKFSGDYNPVVDEESITDTFEETFKKFEVRDQE